MADPLSFTLATVAQIGVSYLFPSDGPRLKDLKISASTYGAAIPWAFGLCRVAGNLVWSDKIVEHKKKKWAGKGGFYNQYTYTCTFAMGLCKGPIKGILRIWADSKIIYDITGGQSGGDLKSLMAAALAGNNTATNKYRMRFYMGDEEQVPDSAIVADKGENATAFRGMAYILFDDFALTDFGNRIPQITAEVYVGETTQTVEVSPYMQADGITPLANDYADNEIAFDTERNYAYLRYGTAITQLSLKTSKVVQSFTGANFLYPGGADLAHILGIGRDGFVYSTFGDNLDCMPIARMDPYSMQAVISFGTNENITGIANTQTSFVAPVSFSTAYAATSIEYLLTVGTEGQLGMLRATTMAYEWGEAAYLGGAPSSGYTFSSTGADPDTTNYPIFYVMWGNSTGWKLTRLQNGIQTDVQTVTGTGISVGSCVWDSAVPGVLMFWTMDGVKYLSKWSKDTNAEAWRITVAGYPDEYTSQSRVISGRFAWSYAGRLYTIDTATGEMLDDQVDPNTGEITPGDGDGYALPVDYSSITAQYQAFDSTRSMLNGFQGVEGAIFLNTATSGCTVGAIVNRLLLEGGLDQAQIDLTSINSINVRGYGWASSTDVKGILDELQRLYLFDLVEREGMLIAVLRGDIADEVNGAETIPQNILGSSGGDASDFWVETRTQEPDIPAKVSLTYMNYADDYMASTAHSQRTSAPYSTMYSRQQLAMEINVALIPSEAKAQVKRILYSQWAERVSHATRLPWAYLNLDPGDVITVAMNDGRSYNDRVNRMEVGADMAIATDTYSQDSGAYDGWDGISADGGGTGTQVLPGATIVLPFVFNTPLLRDQDDTGGSYSLYYTGLGNGATGDFGGGALYRSENSIDYDLLNSSDSDLEWGTVVGTFAPPACGTFAMDWKTQVTILPSVPWFELQSITDDELWAGANPCIIGGEVIQFRDCIENDDGTWTIYNLLRGRRGTEYACENHVAGERFVFFNNTTIVLQGDTTSSRGLTRYFKGVGSGKTLGEVTASSVVYEPRDLMPYAVGDIRRTLASDITITWARRTRLGGNLQDGTGEVALSEASEKYEVYILESPFSGDLSRGSQPTNYLRMYPATSPTVTYTAAEQTEDGFNQATDTLHLVIYQLSDVVGRGFPSPRDIAPDSST